MRVLVRFQTLSERTAVHHAHLGAPIQHLLARIDDRAKCELRQVRQPIVELFPHLSANETRAETRRFPPIGT